MLPTAKIIDGLRLIQNDERVDLHARGCAEAAADEIERAHGKLAQIVCVCDDNRSDDCNSTALALKFVRDVATTR